MTPPKGAKPARSGPTRVEVVRHKDKRTNIPTDELRGFVADDEKASKPALYPRDPSLDPQLVWRGKDEQDQGDLEVPTVPIYIQEKIQPRVLVENLRRTAERPEDEPELLLFSDFNGIEFEDLVDFYAHEQNWTNRLILGDGLLTMNSLAEKEGLRGKVQTIYIDPPYGIGFDSNWQVSTKSTQVKDGRLSHFSREPEQIRAFRDTWSDGIHSYLSYLRDRLVVARDLLADSGSIFVQISDENVHLVRSLLDEVFGADCFCSQISFRTKIPLRTSLVPNIYDHVLWYARTATNGRPQPKFRRLFQKREVGAGTPFVWVEERDGTRRRMTPEEQETPARIPEGARIFRLTDLVSSGRTESCVFSFELDGEIIPPHPSGKSWKTNPAGVEKLKSERRIFKPAGTPNYVFYADDYPVQELPNVWTDTQGASGKTYVVQTATRIIERCILMTTDPGDLVLDPTCGSGTTAYVAEMWGRRWITIDTSRVAVALARTRMTSGRFPYWLLADSDAGRSRMEALGRAVAADPPREDVRRGFVLKQVPHVTLGAITGMVVGDDSDPGDGREELLVDQPYEDKRVVRVCGPFTVESLSPHRVLSEEEQPESEAVPESSGNFEDTILSNLLKAGVQNRDKAQRLTFDSLEPYAGGRWLHARGSFTDEAGEARTVGISLGPEYGTVGSEQVREAAKEAVKGVGFDLLLVCGFAFDAHSNETAKEFAPAGEGGWAVAAEERKIGRLPVLLVRMNQDLSMGQDLLKKTGTGNLFMVFGEPDIVIEHDRDGKVEVEVRGVDVYDPTTGEIRSDSTDDIACWFIDTNYNGESFFVRDAYFTGANDPYKRLRQALKADIDEEAWASLYRTRSRPFAAPDTGVIAVKVINHHGDEVMKTYAINP